MTIPLWVKYLLKQLGPKKMYDINQKVTLTKLEIMLLYINYYSV